MIPTVFLFFCWPAYVSVSSIWDACVTACTWRTEATPAVILKITTHLPWDMLSHGPGACQGGWTGCLKNPRDPVFVFLVLGLHICHHSQKHTLFVFPKLIHDIVLDIPCNLPSPPIHCMLEVIRMYADWLMSPDLVVLANRSLSCSSCLAGTANSSLTWISLWMCALEFIFYGDTILVQVFLKLDVSSLVDVFWISCQCLLLFLWVVQIGSCSSVAKRVVINRVL